MILTLLVAFRIIGSAFPETLPNFQPLAALFFCGALMAKGWRAWAIPLAAWALTYPAPAIISGTAGYLAPAEILTTGVAFAATFLMGKRLSGAGFASLLAGSVAAAFCFHAITNGAAWIGDPRYQKTLTGLWQSLWTGAPGSEIPSWVFLRNMTCANLLFTAVFLSARIALPQTTPAKLPATAR